MRFPLLTFAGINHRGETIRQNPINAQLYMSSQDNGITVRAYPKGDDLVDSKNQIILRPPPRSSFRLGTQADWDVVRAFVKPRRRKSVKS